jgi:integrase/recombinase XerC
LEGFEDFLKSSGMYVTPSGEAEVGKADRIAIRKYLSFLHRKNRKSSIARKLSTLRSFFKYLVREQIVPSNPAKSISTPKVEKTLPTTLSVDEIFLKNLQGGQSRRVQGIVPSWNFFIRVGCA